MKFNDYFTITKSFSNTCKQIPKDALFFDIETTGLSAVRSHLYLIGMAWMEPSETGCRSRWRLVQLFLDHPTRERELLEEFSEILSRHNGPLIHYNGTTFDLPYLMKKYRFYGLKDPIFPRASSSHDLDRILRPFKRILSLSSMKQTDLERLAGIARDDPYTGGELISVYEQYAASGDESLLLALLAHNREDIEHLISLFSFSEISAFFSGAFIIEAIKGESSEISIRLRSGSPTPVPVTAENDFCSLCWEGELASLILKPYLGTLKHYFPDYKNYYYLPKEDMAIHKSVGSFVDAAHR
jgi:uncharacterized protein YprB with RNaseH-like and TPR domain